MRSWLTVSCICAPSLVLLAGAGCAPTRLETGLEHYADQYHVRDAGARRAGAYWYLRFDELLISDLDDALEAGAAGRLDDMRRLGLQAVQGAGALARRAAAGELDRLPGPGRERMARLAGTGPDAAALREAYTRRQEQALAHLAGELGRAAPVDLGNRLRSIRTSIEQAPDDQGRAGRRLMLGWAALPAWMGVDSIEKKTRAEHPPAEPQPFDRCLAIDPAGPFGDELLARYAPALVLEWPEHRSYPPDVDRFGQVYLAGTPDAVQVNVNTSMPRVYAYRSEAKVGGKRYPQLVYVWWFPERPAMSADDPVAGRVDGDTLRITLDSHGRPAVFEVVQGCGCGHLVYVAEAIEQRARARYGPPQAGKELSVERDVENKRDLIVSGTVAVAGGSGRPVIYVKAGYHAVSGLRWAEPAASRPAEVLEQGTYTLEAYDHLSHLPLGDGVASMFGPDGLVHNAGRKEGFLLAPTGMLSAGQPRQRGTQKIRWDAYSFDDPRLLERALRLPEDL